MQMKGRRYRLETEVGIKLWVWLVIELEVGDVDVADREPLFQRGSKKNNSNFRQILVFCCFIALFLNRYAPAAAPESPP